MPFGMGKRQAMMTAEEIRTRLRAFRGRYIEIARDTGLSIDWIRHFASGGGADIKLSKAVELDRWLDQNEPAESRETV